MEVIKQGSGEGVVWLKCPSCQGFLPYMSEEDNDDTTPESGADSSAVAIEDLDIDNAKEYSEDQLYELDDVIHHRSWNDFGKIVSKDALPGNRRTIWVQFLRHGKVQLLEGVVQED
jgi:hypothetical protein